MCMHVVNICSGEVNHAYIALLLCMQITGDLTDEYLIMSMISRHVSIYYSLIYIRKMEKGLRLK